VANLGTRESDIIYTSREATYSLMKNYKCSNCKESIFAMYELNKKSIMVSCRKCKHFETTETSEPLRSFLLAQLGEDRISLILSPKKIDPRPEPAKKIDTVPEDSKVDTSSLLGEIDTLLDNLKP